MADSEEQTRKPNKVYPAVAMEVHKGSVSRFPYKNKMADWQPSWILTVKNCYCNLSGSPKDIFLKLNYGPCTVRSLKQGETKLWCACGLSKKQPWCDGSHKGTGIKPLKWTVNKSQSLFAICACKYTKDAPFCDATHTNLPCEVEARQENCTSVHLSDSKLCTGCGWVPDF